MDPDGVAAAYVARLAEAISDTTGTATVAIGQELITGDLFHPLPRCFFTVLGDALDRTSSLRSAVDVVVAAASSHDVPSRQGSHAAYLSSAVDPRELLSGLLSMEVARHPQHFVVILQLMHAALSYIVVKSLIRSNPRAAAADVTPESIATSGNHLEHHHEEVLKTMGPWLRPVLQYIAKVVLVHLQCHDAAPQCSSHTGSGEGSEPGAPGHFPDSDEDFDTDPDIAPLAPRYAQREIVASAWDGGLIDVVLTIAEDTCAFWGLAAALHPSAASDSIRFGLREDVLAVVLSLKHVTVSSVVYDPSVWMCGGGLERVANELAQREMDRLKAAVMAKTIRAGRAMGSQSAPRHGHASARCVTPDARPEDCRVSEEGFVTPSAALITSIRQRVNHMAYMALRVSHEVTPVQQLVQVLRSSCTPRDPLSSVLFETYERNVRTTAPEEVVHRAEKQRQRMEVLVLMPIDAELVAASELNCYSHHEVREMDANVGTPVHGDRQRIGAALLLAELTVLTGQSECSSDVSQLELAMPSITFSPRSLLEVLLTELPLMLRDESLNGLSHATVFLGHLVLCVPCFTIDIPGEVAPAMVDGMAEPSGSMSADDVRSRVSQFKTARFGAYFDAIKALLTVATLTPSPVHRTVARQVARELLDRLIASVRAEMYGRLLALTPYGSVCCAMLHDFRFEVDEEQWHLHQQPRGGGHGAPRAFTSLNCLSHLVLAQELWIAKVRQFDASFVDAIVLSLSALRLFLVRELALCDPGSGADPVFRANEVEGEGITKRLRVRESVLRHACTGPRDKLTGCSPWECLIARAVRQVLEPLRELVATQSETHARLPHAPAVVSSGALTVPTGLSAKNCISPVDAFAVNGAIDALHRLITVVLDSGEA